MTDKSYPWEVSVTLELLKYQDRFDELLEWQTRIEAELAGMRAQLAKLGPPTGDDALCPARLEDAE